MQLVYLILAHHRPHQLARLVDRLDSPNALFLLHIDAKADAGAFFLPLEPTIRRDNVFLVPRVKCHWAQFGHVEATLNGIELAFREAPRFDYLALLTGTDYPIKPPTRIEGVLADWSGTCFMNHFRLPREGWHGDGGVERVERRWFKVAGKLRSFPSPRVPLPPKRTMPLDLVPYQGMAYWWLPRDALAYVREFLIEHPRYLRFFRRVLAPDESFFHTIVLNSRYHEQTVQEDLRYSDWSAGGWHPATLTGADFPKLATSDALLARKFDEEVDVAVLDRIDEELLGYRPAAAQS